MDKSSPPPERVKRLQALSISFLILGALLTRAASLPPIVMALEEQLVDQRDCSVLNQLWDQIELGPLYVHLHRHEILL